MALQLSIPIRNAMAAAIEATAGTAAKLRFYTGAKPADCGTAPTGTLLAELTLPSDYLAAPSAGAVALQGSWTGAATTAGTAGYFRLYDSAGTTCHAQGAVTITAVPWVTGTAVTSGAYRTNAGNLYQSTGAGTTGATAPTHGTGTVSDGTVSWTYVSAYGDLTLDNPVIAAGQTVTQTTFGITVPNA